MRAMDIYKPGLFRDLEIMRRESIDRAYHQWFGEDYKDRMDVDEPNDLDIIVIVPEPSLLDYEYGKKEVLEYAKRIGLPSSNVIHQPLANNGYDIQYLLGIKELFQEEINVEDAPLIVVGDSETLAHEEMNADDNSAGLIAKMKDLQAHHIYFDPFSVFYTPLNYVIADFYSVQSNLCLKLRVVFVPSLVFMVGRKHVGLLTYARPRLILDPGKIRG